MANVGGISITITGIEALLKRLGFAQAAATPMMGKSLYQEALRIFAESQRLVPVATGTLRSSGVVEPPTVSGDDVEVLIGYGGAASAYAIYVHEIVDNWHAPPTQAKFLEQPVLEAQARLGSNLRATMSGLFGP